MKDFYEHQGIAIARTVKLVFLLVIAVIGTVLLTAAAVTYLLVLILAGLGSFDLREFALQWAEIYGVICTVTALFVGASSWHKMKQLSAGGKVIALDLGGERVTEKNADKFERRLLNIVGEMSVAAGIPTPQVYLLRQQAGINAFAAGLTLEDAVIGVTRGAITQLNRDQLQGVIAHEFSHILNGDMRLNLRLTGALHGVLGVALLAEGSLHAAHDLTSTPAEHRYVAYEMIAALAIAVVGILLWPIGIIGTLFALVVMSAASQQREFLADASAVELTRNPEGIAGALKILAGHRAGSRVRSPKTMELSHFFFACGAGFATGRLATHPPIDVRILRLDPSWDGIPLFPEDDDGNPANTPEGTLALVTGQASPTLGESDCGSQEAASSVLGSGETGLAESTGLFGPANNVANDLGELPEVLVRAARDAPATAAALLIALWNRSENDADHAAPSTGQLSLPPEDLPADERHVLQLFDVALSTLRCAGGEELNALAHRFTSRKQPPECGIDRWSWSLQVRQAAGMESPGPTRFGRPQELADACEIALSFACHVGTDSDAMAQYAFQRGVVQLDLHHPRYRQRAEISWQQIEASLDLIAQSSRRCRRQILTAMGSAVAADQVVTADEAYAMRGICAAIGVDVPRLLPGHPLVPS